MRIARGIIIAAALTAGLVGCGQKSLMDLRSNSEGPDEFLILPAKPLTMPQDYASLPAPTPGGSNITDQDPLGDANIALGGRREAPPTGTAVPSSDTVLVAQASRYGVPSNTRQELAAEDAEFRRKQTRGTRIRLFPVDRYAQAYRKQAIDPFQIGEAFRNSNYGTPSFPPAKP